MGDYRVGKVGDYRVGKVGDYRVEKVGDYSSRHILITNRYFFYSRG